MASDIDLKKGILELVDNAIDEWKLRGKPTLKVDLELNVEKKELTYEDNAGGIKEGNLNLLMQPRGYNSNPHRKHHRRIRTWNETGHCSAGSRG